ncbi:hypothetical protein F7734_27505 [Scytonema sp. UIC 10036]|nr:hypothetical protein [Scytonema sp. UIC 10036]
MQKQAVSLAEAARHLGVSQSTLYVAVQKGQIFNLGCSEFSAPNNAEANDRS